MSINQEPTTMCLQATEVYKRTMNEIEKQCNRLSEKNFANFLNVKFIQIKDGCNKYKNKCDILILYDAPSDDLAFSNKFLLKSISSINNVKFPCNTILYITYNRKNSIKLWNYDSYFSTESKKCVLQKRFQSNNVLQTELDGFKFADESSDSKNMVIEIGIQDELFKQGISLLYMTRDMASSYNDILPEFHPCIAMSIHRNENDYEILKPDFMFCRTYLSKHIQLVSFNEENLDEHIHADILTLCKNLQLFTNSILREIFKLIIQQPRLIDEVMDSWYALHSLAIDTKFKQSLTEKLVDLIIDFQFGFQIFSMEFQDEQFLVTKIKKCDKIDFYEELKRIITHYNSEDNTKIYMPDLDTVFVINPCVSNRRLFDHIDLLNSDLKKSLSRLFSKLFAISAKPIIFRPDNLYLGDDGEIIINTSIPPNRQSSCFLKNNFPVRPFYLHPKCSLISNEQNLYSFGWLIWILLEGSGSPILEADSLKCLEILNNCDDYLIEIIETCWNVEESFDIRSKIIQEKLNIEPDAPVDIDDNEDYSSLLMQSVLTLAREVKYLKDNQGQPSKQVRQNVSVLSQKSSQTTYNVAMEHKAVGTYDEILFTTPPTERMLLEVGRPADNNTVVQMCSPLGDWTWRLEGAQNEKAWSQLIGGGGGIFSPPVLLPAVLEGAKVRFWLRKNICDFAQDEMECCCRLDKDTYNQYGTPLPITALCDIDIFHPDTLQPMGRFSRMLPLIELQREVHVFKVRFSQLDPKRPALFHIRFRTPTDWQDSQFSHYRSSSSSASKVVSFSSESPQSAFYAPSSGYASPTASNASMIPPPHLFDRNNTFTVSGGFLPYQHPIYHQGNHPVLQSKSISGTKQKASSSPDMMQQQAQHGSSRKEHKPRK